MMTHVRPRTATAAVALALALVGCGSGDGTSSGDGDGEAGSRSVSVLGTDGLQFEPSSLSAPAGTVEVELTAEETVQHTFVIEELDDTEVVAAAPGETSTGSVDLEAGTYTFYCGVPGHRAAGMEGELTVSS